MLSRTPLTTRTNLWRLQLPDSFLTDKNTAKNAPPRLEGALSIPSLRQLSNQPTGCRLIGQDVIEQPW